LLSIQFSCQCGKQIKVADQFAGRQGKCPACGEVVTIPQPEVSDDIDGDLLYEALGGNSEPEPVATAMCSACAKPIPITAVLCSHCGYNSQTQAYAKAAQAGEAKEKKGSRAPLMSIAGIELSWWKVALLVAVIVAIPVWYYTGPSRDLLLNDVQTVNVVEPILSGGTHAPYSQVAMLSGFSRGAKKPKPKIDPATGKPDEVYSLGSGDRLIVTKPDERGDYLLLEVALQQDAILNMNRTNKYDSLIAGNDFKLVPVGGGTPVEGRLLDNPFQGNAEIDLSGANTSSYPALFPMKPTQVDEDKQYGTINGKAYWSEPLAQGQIAFTSYYGYGEGQTPKGLRATGKLKLTNTSGNAVDMDYAGGTLNIDWDNDSAGWWSKSQYKHTTRTSPWHRYHLRLLFKRPAAGGKFHLTYCDKTVATFWVDPTPASRTPGVSPMKKGGSKNGGSSSVSNPLEYFDVLSGAMDQARGLASASNMRQIGFGLQLYLNQNGQVWPQRLNQLVKMDSNFKLVMVNPRTGADPGFIYVRPKPGADPATTAVLYEALNGKPDPNGAVLYADGHFE
jgi:hypothetical protein